jgi:hypothetical protein
MPSLKDLAGNPHAGMEHETFTPHSNPIGSAIAEWARGVKQRTLHPLETLAKAATDVRNMSATDMAMQFGGPSGGALSGMVGMFAGKGAKTADVVKLALAEKMKAAGIADDVIHAQTGWFSGMPDGKWRFEIPDDAAKFTKEFPVQGRQINAPQYSDIFEHPELTKAGYSEPSLMVSNTGKSKGKYADYVGDKGAIYVDELNPLAAKSTTLHELQHAIQQREGFARGGSPSQDIVEMTPEYQAWAQSHASLPMSPSGDAVNRSMALYDQIPDKFKAYQRLAGEAEARLTQARMAMNAKQRAASYPPSMFDVPVEQQIVRYGDGPAMSVPKASMTELLHGKDGVNQARGGYALPTRQQYDDILWKQRIEAKQAQADFQQRMQKAIEVDARRTAEFGNIQPSDGIPRQTNRQ